MTSGVVPLARVVRGRMTEGVHFGVAVVSDADGRTIWRAGPSEFRTFPRSALKPFQLLPLVELGRSVVQVTEEELAVAAGSHCGEAYHLRAVRRLLARAHLWEHSLECGVHEPLDRKSADELARLGEPPAAIHNQCSGQHAALLLLARDLAINPTGYANRRHPVQAAVRHALLRLIGARPSASAIDGCGVPTYALTIRQISTGYACLGRPDKSPSYRHELERIRSAMIHRPEWVGGSAGRLDTELMQADQGLVAKVGADGIFAVGHPAGLGLVVKLVDGDATGVAIRPIVLEILRGLGWIQHFGDLGKPSMTPLRNWRGEVVGRVEAVSQREMGLPVLSPPRHPDRGPHGATSSSIATARGLARKRASTT